MKSHEIGDTEYIFYNPEVRCATRGVVINEKDGVLILTYKKYAFSVLPGGGLQEGENPEEGFKREILEKTGVDCKIIAALPTIIDKRSAENLIQYHYAFIARVSGDVDHQQLDDGEIADGVEVERLSFFQGMTKIFEQEIATFQQTCLSKRDYFIMNESLLYLFSDKLK